MLQKSGSINLGDLFIGIYIFAGVIVTIILSGLDIF